MNFEETKQYIEEQMMSTDHHANWWSEDLVNNLSSIGIHIKKEYEKQIIEAIQKDLADGTFTVQQYFLDKQSDTEKLEIFKDAEDIAKNSILNQMSEKEFKDLINDKLEVDDISKLLESEDIEEKNKKAIIDVLNINKLEETYLNFSESDKLIELMDDNKKREFYTQASDETKKQISNDLFHITQNIQSSIDRSVNDINSKATNITNYYSSIKGSKSNIKEQKDVIRQSKSDIKFQKMIIKNLGKRKSNLERKLQKTSLKRSSRISFIAKRKAEKIQRLTQEINSLNNDINKVKSDLASSQNNLEQAKNTIITEKDNIKQSRENITTSNEDIINITKQQGDSRIKIKQVSDLHKSLIGKKEYNHQSSSRITTISKRTTSGIQQNNQPPEQVVQQSGQTVKQPEQTIQQPEQTVQQPEQTIQQSGQTVQQPEQPVQQPEQTIQQSKQTVQRPEQIIQQLSDDNMQLNQQNDLLKQQIEELKRQNEELEKQNNQLKQQNQQKTQNSDQPQMSNFREKFFNNLTDICNTYGINMNLPYQINSTQSVVNIPSTEIVSMSQNQYKQLQLCCVALMYQLIQMNNEKTFENEQGKGLTNSGFSNTIMLILVLLIFTLISIIILLMIK